MQSLIEVWKQTIEVQKHFNDIVLRIRNLALTLLLAVFGAAALALREDLQVLVYGKRLSLAAVVLAVGLIGWVAFYFMDRFWYHKLLVGAVVHGTALESIWGPELVGKTFVGLTGTITKESRTTSQFSRWFVCFSTAAVAWAGVLFFVSWPLSPAQVFIFVTIALAAFVISGVAWKGELKARFKLDLFYFAGIALLLILALIANGGVVLHPSSKPLTETSPF